MYFTVADRAKGDDHHVETVQQRPAFDRMKADGSDRGQTEQSKSDPHDSAESLQRIWTGNSHRGGILMRSRRLCFFKLGAERRRPSGVSRTAANS